MEKITTTETLDVIIAKAKENLSDETRAAINAVSWRLILSGINKKYTPDQLDSLELETELLLCGLLTPVEYPKELEGRMRLHKAEVETLINEIDKLIFKKIQEELEKRLAEKPKDAPTIRKSFSPDPLFVSLPMQTQEAIALSEWKDSVYQIAKKYVLNIEQTGELESIIIKTLTNVIHTDKLENEIKIKFNLGDDKNKEMVAELNEKIFKKIKDLMQSNVTKTGRAPLPPYKVITNDQLLITNNLVKREVPKPANIITNDQLLITNENKESMVVKNIEVQGSEFSPPAKGETQRGSLIDPYKEHGIEIITNDQLLITNEKIKKETTQEIKVDQIKNEPTPITIEHKKTNEEIIKTITNDQLLITNENKAPTQKPLVNMMMDKLMNKTVNGSTVSDHTIPKMGGGSHDPYHEEV